MSLLDLPVIKPPKARMVRLGISVRTGGSGGQATRLTDDERKQHKLEYQRKYRELNGRKS